jgi:predicted metal-dependent hydrolase
MEIKIIRSSRRKKTVSMREINGVIQLYLPLGVSERKELEYVQWARKRFEAGRRKKELKEKNAGKQLEQRAKKFNREYFEGKLSWEGIIYSTAQNGRMFGICDIRKKSIRISDRLLKMPKFVHDYVLIHELAHLEIPGHGHNFWEIVNRYPKTERARGYLMAVGMSD